MLLERIDELPLASHDLRGNPSALLGSIVQRIDRLKDELVTAGDYAAWAAKLPEDGEPARARAAREREFAAIYAAHDRMLAEAGTLDFGDLVLHAFRLLRTKPHVRARLAARFRHVLVDEFQDTNFAQNLLLRLLVAEHGNVTAAADDDQAIHRFRGASTKNVADFRAEWPDATVVRLTESFRSGGRILAAARAVVEPDETRTPKRLEPRPALPDGEVAFWRCANERAQAQAVAADVERLVAREDVAPEDVCVLVRSVSGEGQAVAAALEERAVPYRLSGAAAFFQRAEVRDLLAWLRLLVDPGDAGAVVRALARPPIELRAIDLARCTQIARRRKLDMVAALGAAHGVAADPARGARADRALPQALPLGRGRARLDAPDLYVHRLIERLGLRRQLLFAASTEVVERLVNLAKFGELAADYLRRSPQATAREFARSIAAVADAGLREEEAAAGDRPRGVQVMAMHAAKGLEFDHVYVLGLMAARMPGPRQRTLEPIPDALIKEALPPDSKAVHVGADAAAAARRDDARAAAARARLPGRDRARRGAAAVAVRRGGARRARRGVGGARGGAVRPGRDAAVDVPAAARRAAHDRAAGRRPARRAALRHRPRRLARGRALPRGAQALGADGAHARRRAVGRRGAARGQRAAAAGGDRRAARDLRDVGARRVPARRRARREAARPGGRAADRAVAGAVPAAPRRRARAERDRHRDLPDLPAQVQVRARVPDPVGADAQPALRDPRPPGARALPRRRRDDRLAARAARAARGGLAPRRLRRLRGGAPAARQGDPGAAALPRALPGRGRRAGLVRARVLVPARAAPAARARRPRRQAARTAATS